MNEIEFSVARIRELGCSDKTLWGKLIANNLYFADDDVLRAIETLGLVTAALDKIAKGQQCPEEMREAAIKMRGPITAARYEIIDARRNLIEVKNLAKLD